MEFRILCFTILVLYNEWIIIILAMFFDDTASPSVMTVLAFKV